MMWQAANGCSRRARQLGRRPIFQAQAVEPAQVFQRVVSATSRAGAEHVVHKGSRSMPRRLGYNPGLGGASHSPRRKLGLAGASHLFGNDPGRGGASRLIGQDLGFWRMNDPDRLLCRRGRCRSATEVIMNRTLEGCIADYGEVRGVVDPHNNEWQIKGRLED